MVLSAVLLDDLMALESVVLMALELVVSSAGLLVV